MPSVIRAYPSLPGPSRKKGSGEEGRVKEGKRADSLTSVQHTDSIIAGMHAALADV